MSDPSPDSQNAEATSLSAEQLLPLVYAELHTLAVARLANQGPGVTLQPTALVHEAWLKLAQTRRQEWADRAHFYRAAALAMRHIMTDRARQKATLKHAGGMQRLDIADLDLESIPVDDRVLLIDESLQRLEAEDKECAEVVLLKFFSGLSNKETAETLGISESTVERRWSFARVRLFQIIRESEDSAP